MFTGIIEELGIVKSLKKSASGAKIEIGAGPCIKGTNAGDSLNVNGACLTVAEVAKKSLAFDISKETLSRSALGMLKPADIVNLERALKADSRLGGHFVTGHVDCIARIISVKRSGDFVDIDFNMPLEFMRYITPKGSVAVDGISLTINSVGERHFSITVIPRTLLATTLSFKKREDIVNIEADIIAKYIERLALKSTKPHTKTSLVTKEYLHKYGFI